MTNPKYQKIRSWNGRVWMDWYGVVYPAVQILVTNTDKLLGWPFEEVGREELRDGGLGDRIQSEGDPHWSTVGTGLTRE